MSSGHLTLVQVQNIASDVHISYPLCTWEMSFKVEEATGYRDTKYTTKDGTVAMAMVTLRAGVPDRFSGSELWVQFRPPPVALYMLKTELDVLNHLRVVIQDFLKHEIDESFMYKCKRFFDPHASEEKT